MFSLLIIDNFFSNQTLLLTLLTTSRLYHNPTTLPSMGTVAMNLINMVPKTSQLLFLERHKISTGAFAWKFSYVFGETTYICPSSILAELLFAEYKFRYQAQLRGSLENDNTEEDPNAEDEGIAIKYDELEHNLYLKESALPDSNLKKLYDSLRKDPSWYLRKGLIEDCAARGGCCARKCGCCAKRLKDLPRKGISGHCSLACPCCDKKGGRNPGSESVATMDRQYKEALGSENPFHLARIASLYFDELRPCTSSECQLSGRKPPTAEGSDSLGTNSNNRALEGGERDEAFNAGPPPYERYTSGSDKNSPRTD